MTSRPIKETPATRSPWYTEAQAAAGGAVAQYYRGACGLTGVCKNEIIATNRPRHPWIPAYAGMTEWAR